MMREMPMALDDELEQVIELARIRADGDGTLRPQALMDALRLTLGWESSKAQARVLRAIELGMLKFTPTYHIIPG